MVFELLAKVSATNDRQFELGKLTHGLEQHRQAFPLDETTHIDHSTPHARRADPSRRDDRHEVLVPDSPARHPEILDEITRRNSAVHQTQMREPNKDPFQTLSRPRPVKPRRRNAVEEENRPLAKQPTENEGSHIAEMFVPSDENHVRIPDRSEYPRLHGADRP